MSVFTPTQDIENIQSDLATIAVGNLGWNADLVFSEEPDGPVPDNSIVILFRQLDVKDNTNGKFAVRLTFAILLVLDPTANRNTRPTLNGWAIPFCLAYEAWYNQTLNNDYERIDVQKGGVGRVQFAGQPYDALTVFVAVDTEFNIPMS